MTCVTLFNTNLLNQYTGFTTFNTIIDCLIISLTFNLLVALTRRLLSIFVLASLKVNNLLKVIPLNIFKIGFSNNSLKRSDTYLSSTNDSSSDSSKYGYLLLG